LETTARRLSSLYLKAFSGFPFLDRLWQHHGRMPPDEIHLSGLELPTRIGVPAEERAGWQTLSAHITLRLAGRCEDCEEDLSRTIDYAAVAARLRQLAAERPRKLVETLAAEMSRCLLSEFGAKSVIVEIRKRILPGTDWVAVRIERPIPNKD
jgi:dihydroneopterin aldolase